MVREIKFRAWVEKDRDYVTDYDTGEYGQISLNFHGPGKHVAFSKDLSCNCAPPGCGGCQETYYEKEEIVLEQFTGLHDSNGTEIYEGDIVNFTFWWFDGNERDSNLCGDVVYIKEQMSFGLRHVKNSDWCDHVGADREVGDTDAFGMWRFSEDNFEVIGNIHENPELVAA